MQYITHKGTEMTAPTTMEEPNSNRGPIIKKLS